LIALVTTIALYFAVYNMLCYQTTVFLAVNFTIEAWCTAVHAPVSLLVVRLFQRLDIHLTIYARALSEVILSTTVMNKLKP